MSGVATMTFFDAMSPTGVDNEPPSATTRTTMSRSVTTASTRPLFTTGTAPVSSACITRAAAWIVSFGDTVQGFGVITSRIFIEQSPLRFLHAKRRPSVQRVHGKHLHPVKRDVLLPAYHVGHRSGRRDAAEIDTTQQLPCLPVEDEQAGVAREEHQAACSRQNSWLAARIRNVPHLPGAKWIHRADERAHGVPLGELGERRACLLGRRASAEPAIAPGTERILV